MVYKFSERRGGAGALFASALLCLLAGVTSRACAQEPTDNDVWKSRCLTLSAQSTAIDKASAPAELLQTTRGIAGQKFAAVAHGRADAGQHYTACTLYYTAAMAEHQGNGGKVDAGRAHTDVVLGGAEAKRASGLPLSFKEKMDRTSSKVNPIGKGSLTPADLGAVYAAFEGSGPAPPQSQAPTSWDSGPAKSSGGYNPNAPLPPSTPKRKASAGTTTPPPQSWPQR